MCPLTPYTNQRTVTNLLCSILCSLAGTFSLIKSCLSRLGFTLKKTSVTLNSGIKYINTFTKRSTNYPNYIMVSTLQFLLYKDATEGHFRCAVSGGAGQRCAGKILRYVLQDRNLLCTNY